MPVGRLTLRMQLEHSKPYKSNKTCDGKPEGNYL